MRVGDTCIVQLPASLIKQLFERWGHGYRLAKQSRDLIGKRIGLMMIIAGQCTAEAFDPEESVVRHSSVVSLFVVLAKRDIRQTDHGNTTNYCRMFEKVTPLHNHPSVVSRVKLLTFSAGTSITTEYCG